MASSFGGGPTYGVLGVLVEYDELVFGRAAGVDAGHHVHCTEFGDYALFEAFEAGSGFVLEEFLVGGVVDYFCRALDAVALEGFLDFVDFAHISVNYGDIFECSAMCWLYVGDKLLFIGCKVTNNY